MHTWETMMSAASNFELQNWHANLASIKPEPIDSPQHSEPDSFDHKTLLFDSLNPSSYGGSHPLGFNPLTPPGYPNVLLPQHQHHSLHRPSTPCSTRTEVFAPPPNLTPTNTPPMDVTPPKSPPKDGQETPEKDVTSEYGDSYDGMSEDDGDIRTPKVNSHGKIKTYKCKQCGFVAVTKVSFWDHTKSHMKPEKILTCQKCPFVTEYKHHLEYHLRNHQRSKPFQCSQCSYSCVNKSMLNSHLKSHSSVFQYRCADCSYATKYCHSLKLHLRKYTHKPDVVLNLDGTPNPLPIIDVYGTRRGPKAKPKQRDSPPPPPPPALAPKETSPEPGPNIPDLAKIFQNTPPNMPLFPYLNLNLHMFAAQRMAQLDSQAPHPPEEALNLVQKEQVEPRTPKHRRKGRAFKLDRSMDVEDEDTSGADNEAHAIGSSNDAKEATSSSSNSINNSNNNSPEVVISARKQFECKFCDISFKDDVLYTIHMGYHGYNDVFKCNMCGEKCDDRVSFFLHIARSSHT